MLGMTGKGRELVTPDDRGRMLVAQGDGPAGSCLHRMTGRPGAGRKRHSDPGCRQGPGADLLSLPSSAARPNRQHRSFLIPSVTR